VISCGKSEYKYKKVAMHKVSFDIFSQEEPEGARRVLQIFWGWKRPFRTSCIGGLTEGVDPTEKK